MSHADEFNHERMPELSPGDQCLLEGLMACGFDRARLPQALGRALTTDDERRISALVRLLGFMGDYPVDDAEPALLHATLARIDRHEDQLARKMRFDVAMDEQSSRRGFRIRVPDFITVAAVLLIGVGVLWPVLGSVRQQALDSACANNLKRIGYGFDQYANDNTGSLPFAMAGPMGSWETFRNTMNLNPMVENGYCEHGLLNCPGHHHAAGAEAGPSYSFRWFTPRGLAHWNTGRVTVILGDLNPLVDAARNGSEAPPLSVSVNHGGRGQNVLRSDGATMWLEQPLVGARGTQNKSDNIWMPGVAGALRPGMIPTDESDVFLVH